MTTEPPRPRVKICGLTHREDLELVAAAGADAFGLIVDVPVESPRAIDPEQAAALVAQAPPFLTSVLVTMPDSAARARALLDTVDPDVLQVHGGLSAAEIRNVATDYPTIATFDLAEDLPPRSLTNTLDGILLDSTDEAGAGGTGRTTNWAGARSEVRRLDRPVILAGGLTPTNVAEAIAEVEPYGVDVATGVEGPEPGRKDPQAVRRFVAEATQRGSR